MIVIRFEAAVAYKCTRLGLNIELVSYIFSCYKNLMMQNVIEEEAHIGSKDYLIGPPENST